MTGGEGRERKGKGGEGQGGRKRGEGKLEQGRRLLKPVQDVPWSLHTFPENFMQIAVRPFSRNLADKQTNKEMNKQRNRSKTIPRPPIGGGVIKTSSGAKAQQTPSPCCASRHRPVSLN